MTANSFLTADTYISPVIDRSLECAWGQPEAGAR